MAKLLQGYTNVISPQNLFTDSHFERGGGYPADNPYFTSGRFDESHVLGFFSNSGKVTELRIRRPSDGTIRISGRVHTSAGFQIYNNVNYETGGRARANVPCTNGATIYINSCTTNEVDLLPSRGGNVLYLKAYTASQAIYNKEYKIQSVIVPTTEGYTVAPININLRGSGTFDFTIRDVYIYEGAYLNPPYNFSIDSDFCNPGFLKAFDMGKQIYQVNKAENVNHWFRVAKLGGYGTISTFTPTSDGGSYMLWKGYVIRPWKHSDYVVICHIEGRCIYTKSGTNTYRRSLSIKGTRCCQAAVASGNYWLKRWRIAYKYENSDTVPEIYLETYMNKSGSNDGNPIFVIPEIGISTSSSGYSIPSEKIISNIQQGSYDVVGDDDIMLGSEYTIEDIGEDFTV